MTRSTPFIRSRDPGASRAGAFLLLLAVAAGPVLAGTTGQLRGVVVDAAGSPLIAVVVGASSPSQIGGEQRTTTNSEGEFLYPRLAPGLYTVRLELAGHVTQELTEVQVRLDRTTELQVILPSATFGDEVEVMEVTPVVDPTQISTGQTFTAEYMTETMIGTTNRLFVGMLGQTAGVATDSDGGYVFGIRVFGSTWLDNAYLIDGIDATDPHSRIPTPSLSADALREVVLHTGGFEAEYGQATGGVVNLITKSGGNRFSGSVDYRYRDSDLETSGNHYDPDTQPAKNAQANATLGGPILLDRVWFFTSAWIGDEELTPTGSPTTSDFEPENYLAKLTGQVSPAWSLAGKYVVTPYVRARPDSSRFKAAEATFREEGEPYIAHLDIAGVLSGRALWSLRGGHQVWDPRIVPDDGDLTAIGHFNLDTGESYGNFSQQFYDERARSEVESDLTWFLDTPGSHELKVGARAGALSYTADTCLNGHGRCSPGEDGYFFRDLSDGVGGNLPLFMWVQEAAGPQVFDGDATSLYVQDAWRILPRLTLKLGARWDRVTYQNDAGREVLDLAELQPRLGLAWDVEGDGRSILRASAGRFMHPSSFALVQWTAERGTPLAVWLSCSIAGSAPVEAGGLGLTDPGDCAAAAAARGYGYSTDPEGFDPAGWFLPPHQVFGQSPTRIAPDLDPPHADEVIVAFEREVYRRTSLEASFIHKETRDLIEDTCEVNLPVPTPLTPDTPCGAYVFANLPQARLDFEGWMLRAESRALDRLHVLGSYLYSETKGSIALNTGANPDFDIFPEHFDNRYGYLQDHSRHRVKVNGYVRLPGEWSLGVGAHWRSEFRWTPLDFKNARYDAYFVEPRGSGKAGDVHQLDLQLSKGFPIGPTRLRLIGTVYNLLDTERPVAVCENVSGCGGEFQTGDAIAWQRPRSYEVGVRVEF